MEYADFEAEYQQVVLMLRGDRSGLPTAIARLKDLATTIEDDDDREEAGWDIVALEDAIEKEQDEQPPSDLVRQARRIYAAAARREGTTADRLARAERGVQALTELSGADRDEEQAISSMSHSLDMMIDGIRTEMR